MLPNSIGSHVGQRSTAEVAQPHTVRHDIAIVTVRAQRESLIAPLVTDQDVENAALQPLEVDLDIFERPPLC